MDEQIICCAVAFAIGWLLYRQMSNGFSVGAPGFQCYSHSATSPGYYCCDQKDCNNGGNLCVDSTKPGKKGINHCDTNKCKKGKC